jgi:hypothetical protein
MFLLERCIAWSGWAQLDEVVIADRCAFGRRTLSILTDPATVGSVAARVADFASIGFL